MTAPLEQPLLHAARAWFDAGFAVVPSHEDGGKRPYGRWKEYQSERMSWDELSTLLSSGRYTGIGVLTGRASGDVEMIEIEGPIDLAIERLNKVVAQATRFELISDQAGIHDLLLRVTRGCIEESAGGGMHLFIRVTNGPALGNTKLATVNGKVVAETRGEGGFVVVAPTPARNGHAEGTSYVFRNGGSPEKVVNVTTDERDTLHALFEIALNQDTVGVTEARPEPIPASTYDSVSAFDDYRNRTTWQQIMEPAGWVWSHRDAEHDYWVRPGKSKAEGISASTIDDGPLYNWSSSVALPLQVGLSKGAVYAHLYHGGDLSAAARALGEQGFGSGISYEDLPSWVLPGAQHAPVDDGDLSTSEQAYLNAVQRKYAEMRIVEDAKALMATVKAGQAPPLGGIMLHDFLDQPDEVSQFRIEGMWPTQGRVLLAAAAKSGKTTLVAANLLPSLVDGRSFLGKFDCQPVAGKVVLLNMEVGENTLRRWLRDCSIDNRHKVVIANLRGKASALSLNTEKGRERFIDFLRAQDAEVVILDPLAPVLASLGLDENSNADIAQFFSWWSQVLAEAGVVDDLVVHHTGHAGQRSRGASRLLDEPDAVWTLTRDADEGTGEFSPLEPIRYISVYGRDVEMQPESLTFDATTRALKLTGRGKAETRADQKSEAILAAFNGVPMTKAALKKKLTGNDQKNGYLIDEMLEEGLLTKVSKTANGYFLMLPTIQMEAS
jgi:hypothetical protein